MTHLLLIFRQGQSVRRFVLRCRSSLCLRAQSNDRIEREFHERFRCCSENVEFQFRRFERHRSNR